MPTPNNKNLQKGFVVPLLLAVILLFAGRTHVVYAQAVFSTPNDLSVFGQTIQVCTASCNNLPSPVFKVCPINSPQCSPQHHYTIEFYLDGKPLTTFETNVMVAIPSIAWNGQPSFTQ